MWLALYPAVHPELSVTTRGLVQDFACGITNLMRTPKNPKNFLPSWVGAVSLCYYSNLWVGTGEEPAAVVFSHSSMVSYPDCSQGSESDSLADTKAAALFSAIENLLGWESAIKCCEKNSNCVWDPAKISQDDSLPNFWDGKHYFFYPWMLSQLLGPIYRIDRRDNWSRI